MEIRVFFFAFLFLSLPLLQVIHCQSDEDIIASEVVEGGDLEVAGDEVHDYGDTPFSTAPGVSTVCVFPKNAAHLVTAGVETELLVGLSNQGESSLNVIAIRASIHLPLDHNMFVQNLTIQEFYNASIAVSTQASFPYIFAVSQFLQSGAFDLVGTIIYEVDQRPYQSVFYNGTIEVVESGGFISMESVLLVTFGVGLLGLLGLWLYGQIQNMSKKSKKPSKVEVGTGGTDGSMDEWLEGTAYAKSLSTKSTKN